MKITHRFCPTCKTQRTYEDNECRGCKEREAVLDTQKELEEEKLSTPTTSVSPTGSIRHNVGKPAMSHLDPEFLLGMAKILTMNESKYDKHQWKKGNTTSVPYDSAMRHLLAWFGGENNDLETGESHLLHAAVNLMFCWYYEKNYGNMDDRSGK
jgi:hypothetical protein